jgi:hypothetical protein
MAALQCVQRGGDVRRDAVEVDRPGRGGIEGDRLRLFAREFEDERAARVARASGKSDRLDLALFIVVLRGGPFGADAGGTAAVVGDAAVLVPPGDPGALAAAIGALLADPGRRAALRQKAERRAVALPTADDALAQVGAVYDRIRVSRRRTAPE